MKRILPKSIANWGFVVVVSTFAVVVGKISANDVLLANLLNINLEGPLNINVEGCFDTV